MDPRTPATGGAWVHAPPQTKNRGQGGSGSASLLLPLLTGGESHRYLQNEETHKTAVDFNFFFRFQSVLFDLLLCRSVLSASSSSLFQVADRMPKGWPAAELWSCLCSGLCWFGRGWQWAPLCRAATGGEDGAGSAVVA